MNYLSTALMGTFKLNAISVMKAVQANLFKRDPPINDVIKSVWLKIELRSVLDSSKSKLQFIIDDLYFI